jgi:hypothetical protein
MTTESGSEESNLWIVGMCVSCVGSFLCSVGLLLQKLAHGKIAGTGRKFYTNPYWLLGISLMVLDTVLDVLTFGMAPQSLLASLAALTLVYNSCLAPIALGETMARMDVIAVIVIVVGATMAVMGATKETPVYTNAELRANWARPTVIAYMSMTWFAILCVWYHLERRIKLLPAVRALGALKESTEEADGENALEMRTKRAARERNVSLLSDDGAANQADVVEADRGSETGHRTQTASQLEVEPAATEDPAAASAAIGERFGNRAAVVLAGLTGCIGAQSVIMAKSVVELAKSTFEGQNSFLAEPETYLYIAMLALFLVAQAQFLNMGLAAFDALLMVPMYQVSWIFFCILGGGIFFDEFSAFDWVKWILFPTGALITMFGVFLLTLRPSGAERAAKASGAADAADAADAAESGEATRVGFGAAAAGAGHGAVAAPEPEPSLERTASQISLFLTGEDARAFAHPIEGAAAPAGRGAGAAEARRSPALSAADPTATMMRDLCKSSRGLALGDAITDAGVVFRARAATALEGLGLMGEDSGDAMRPSLFDGSEPDAAGSAAGSAAETPVAFAVSVPVGSREVGPEGGRMDALA